MLFCLCVSEYRCSASTHIHHQMRVIWFPWYLVFCHSYFCFQPYFRLLSLFVFSVCWSLCRILWFIFSCIKKIALSIPLINNNIGCEFILQFSTKSTSLFLQAPRTCFDLLPGPSPPRRQSSFFFFFFFNLLYSGLVFAASAFRNSAPTWCHFINLRWSQGTLTASLLCVQYNGSVTCVNTE